MIPARTLEETASDINGVPGIESIAVLMITNAARDFITLPYPTSEAVFIIGIYFRKHRPIIFING